MEFLTSHLLFFFFFFYQKHAQEDFKMNPESLGISRFDCILIQRVAVAKLFFMRFSFWWLLVNTMPPQSQSVCVLFVVCAFSINRIINSSFTNN